MSLVLETGTGVSGANSYADVAMANAYHAARGNATWTETSTSPDQGKAAALIRATAAIDARYRSRFPGVRMNGRDQTLEWPRSTAEDADGEEIAEDEIPQEIIDATCEAALRELVEAGSMMPDIEVGGAIKRMKAGSVEIEHFGSGSASATFTLIDGILSGLLGSASPWQASAVRG